MQPERRPRYTPQEQRTYEGKAQDLRERLQSGLLSELTPYPQFVVWKYSVEQGKLKKRKSREEPGTIWEREYAEYTGYDESWKQAFEEG